MRGCKPKLYLLFAVIAFAYAQPIENNTSNEVCVATTDQWAPFNFTHEGKLQGIGIDIWNEIADILGITTRFEIKDTWPDVLTAIKQRTCDVTIATQPTENRLKYAIFSKPYADYPIVIVTRTTVGFIDDLEQISDRVIALPELYATTETVLRRYPNIRNVKIVNNIDEGLDAVSKREAFATIGVLPVVSYKMNRRRDNLKISGKTNLRFAVGMMVRSDKKELLEKIDYALAQIPQKTKKQILHKWQNYPNNSHTPPAWVWWLFGFVALVAIMGSFFTLSFKKRLHHTLTKVKRLKHLVYTDPSTSAYSRIYLKEKYDELYTHALESGERFGLIFCDIDNMKKINDTYGHEKGDFVLRQVVKVLSSHLKSKDILGRWGGDEFLILLPHTGEKELPGLVMKLQKAILACSELQKLSVTCSFGYAGYNDKDTKRSIFQRADKRLYAMKKRNHNGAKGANLKYASNHQNTLFKHR